MNTQYIKIGNLFSVRFTDQQTEYWSETAGKDFSVVLWVGRNNRAVAGSEARALGLAVSYSRLRVSRFRSGRS